MKRNKYNISQDDVIQAMIEMKTEQQRYYERINSTSSSLSSPYVKNIKENCAKILQDYIDYVKTISIKDWDESHKYDYNRCRRQLVRDKQNETISAIMQLSGDTINEVLAKYGLKIDVEAEASYTTDGGHALLKFMCENIIFPELEEKFNIAGIKLRPVSCASKNLFDFKHIEIK